MKFIIILLLIVGTCNIMGCTQQVAFNNEIAYEGLECKVFLDIGPMGVYKNRWEIPAAGCITWQANPNKVVTLCGEEFSVWCQREWDNE